jgi:hypothetical protein
MSPRHEVLSKSRGINPSAFPRVTPLFATLTPFPYQCHTKDFSSPLFSYCYALFCTSLFSIPSIFNMLHTLCAKHRGWRIALRVPPDRRASFDRSNLLPLYSLLFFHEAPCT